MSTTPNRLSLLALEPRFVFDGAMVYTFDDAAQAEVQREADLAAQRQVDQDADKQPLALDANGQLRVRVAIFDDGTADNGETFRLQASNTEGVAATGTATILDDGTGTQWTFTDPTTSIGTSATGPGAGFDDDRAVTVSSPFVNEASSYAVFTVDGALGQLVELSLGTGADTSTTDPATSTDYTASMEISVDGGLTWSNYTSGLTALNGTGGTLLVRVPVLQDTTNEVDENFTLTATKTNTVATTGTATIQDDGNGTVFNADGSPNTTVVKDDDRALNVNSFSINEGSPYAVFTVSGVGGAAQAGQLVSLSLANVGTTGLSGLQYYDATVVNGQPTGWVSYTGGLVPLNSAGQLLVRTALTAEQETAVDNGETFTLTATNTGGTGATGTATVRDDGTGGYFAANDTDGVSTVPGGVVLDDDRVLTVTGSTVNEASDWSVFTVAGVAGQAVTLGLAEGAGAGFANIIETQTLQIWNTTTNQWVNYSGATTIPAGGTLLVRASIVAEQDAAPNVVDEPNETFQLIATNTGGISSAGVSTIVDDGNGVIYTDAAPTGTTPATLTGPSSSLDDDRPLSVNSITVNEGSSHAVFTVTGVAGQFVKLALTDGTALIDSNGTPLTDGIEDYGPALEYWNGSAWTAYTTGSFLQIPNGSSTMLVRTAIVNDTADEGAHNFTLTATNTGLTPATGTATIQDDGTGTKWDFSGPAADPVNNIGTTATGPAAGFDDDRAVTVTSPFVNESSPYAVFTVDGALGQLVNLSLTSGSATSGAGNDYTASMEISSDGGLTWTAYTSGLTALNGTGGTLLVRVPVLQDATNEPDETFTLTATKTNNVATVGTATIQDDGNGTVYKADGSPDNDAVKDDDRVVTVTSVAVNEASPFAVFTVDGAQDQLVRLNLLAGTATAGGDYQNRIEYSVNGGASWTVYTGGNMALAGSNGTALVRVPVVNDSTQEPDESFRLVATNTGGIASLVTEGVGTIQDDGNGTVFNDNGTVNNNAIKDDDRALSIASITVNEGSPFAVFTVSGVGGAAQAGQLVSLSLLPGTSSPAMSEGVDFGNGTSLTDSDLQVWDGDSWETYVPGALVALDANGQLQVRTAIVNDGLADNGETFRLQASNTGGTAVTATATIRDDGQGSYWLGNALVPATANERAAAQVYLDDDRPLSVAPITVNEGSPFAVFSVTGAAQQQVKLDLSNVSTTGLSGLQVYDAAANGGQGDWVTYTAGSYVALDAQGRALVRIALTPEQEDQLDTGETFTLTATNTGGRAAVGTATVMDDGTGAYYPNAAPAASGSPVTDPAAVLDDDRLLKVTNITVNEGSPFAVFKVTGMPGQPMQMGLANVGTLGLDGLQYFDAVSQKWLNHSAGSSVSLDATGELLVRTSLSPEQELDVDNGETFTLTVTNSGGRTSVGTAIVKDDGTGSYFAAGNNTGVSLLPSGVLLDDDRVVTVQALPDVSEGSLAVFRVSLPSTTQASITLALQLGTAEDTASANDYVATGLQAYYFDANQQRQPLSVQNGRVVLPAGVTDFTVSVPTVDDSALENSERLSLQATVLGGRSASDSTQIRDDGQGKVYDERGQEDASQRPDDDRVTATAPEARVVAAPVPLSSLPQMVPEIHVQKAVAEARASVSVSTTGAGVVDAAASNVSARSDVRALDALSDKHERTLDTHLYVLPAVRETRTQSGQAQLPAMQLQSGLLWEPVSAFGEALGLRAEGPSMADRTLASLSEVPEPAVVQVLADDAQEGASEARAERLAAWREAVGEEADEAVEPAKGTRSFSQQLRQASQRPAWLGRA